MPYRLAVIGYPILHSKSPALHSALAARNGIQISYEALDVPPDDLADFVSRSRRDFDGYNVSTPHKERIYPLLDAYGETAVVCRSVNTVVNRGGVLTGHSTDGRGAARALRPTLRSEGSPIKVLLLGAGGAAKSIAAALKNENVALTQLRRENKTERWTELYEFSVDADVIINATTLGMSGHSEFDDFAFLDKSRAAVFDIVYNPLETRLLAEARARGLRAIDGLAMLREQAAEAFLLFTGKR